jgi:hypothetical protein
MRSIAAVLFAIGCLLLIVSSAHSQNNQDFCEQAKDLITDIAASHPGWSIEPGDSPSSCLHRLVDQDKKVRVYFKVEFQASTQAAIDIERKMQEHFKQISVEVDLPSNVYVWKTLRRYDSDSSSTFFGRSGQTTVTVFADSPDLRDRVQEFILKYDYNHDSRPALKRKRPSTRPSISR